MNAGWTYTWPTTLRHPSRPPKLVYLDLNHWIALAQAQTHHPEGDAYQETLAACLDAVDRDAAVFPISASIYFEVSKIGQHRQRHDLREVIELVSRYKVVASHSLIVYHEVESLLDWLVGPSPRPIAPLDYLDWGVARALGKWGGFRIVSKETGEDATEEARSTYPGGPEEFDRLLQEAELSLNRETLEGPTEEEEPELRKLGWDPSGVIEIMDLRAQQEMDQVGRFNADPKWRRGRIRDVVATREVLIEIGDPLSRALAERNTNLEAVFPKRDIFYHALNSMPSFDVAVSLKTSYHRDARHQWTRNDIADIDALGSALPYCDIVVTDKEVASHIVRAGLPERLQTTVLSRTADLIQHL